jgi:hypothetical protein
VENDRRIVKGPGHNPITHSYQYDHIQMIGPTIMDKLEWDNSLREIYVDQVSVLENMTGTDAMIAPCLQQAREELANIIETRAGYDRSATRIQCIVRGMATRKAIHFASLSPDPDEFWGAMDTCVRKQMLW